MPRLLYLCDFPPGANSAGALVVDRHLRRVVREGWDVIVSVPEAAARPSPGDGPYLIQPLPHRRFWWPPVSPAWPTSQRLRATLWARSIVRDTPRTHVPEVVLTVLWGNAARTALQVARAWGRPLAVIVHDLFRENKLPPAQSRAASRLESDVLGRADRVWVVSDEMRATLAPLVRRGAISTLPPVPDDAAAPPGGWQPVFRAGPVVAHAGALHGYHVDYLATVARTVAKRGGTLLVITPEKNPALAQLRATGAAFRHQDVFPASRDALAFLAREASALTVMYPLAPDSDRCPPTGFPSRVLEFSHLGLPLVIAAPAGNPVNNWARRHHWPLVLEREDWAELDRLIERLANRVAWQNLSEQMRTLAALACDPEKIHRQFLAELPRSSPSS